MAKDMATRTVGPWTFRAELPVKIKPDGKKTFNGADLLRLDRAVAAWLAIHGAMAPASVRFLRTVCEWSQAELARLLAVDLRTVARWESGESPITRNAFKLLCVLALDALHVIGRVAEASPLAVAQANPVRESEQPVELELSAVA